MCFLPFPVFLRTGQWKLTASAAHLDVCLRVADECRAKQKPMAFGILYDEVARKEWADMARKNAPGFDVNKACLKLDKVRPPGCGPKSVLPLVALCFVAGPPGTRGSRLGGAHKQAKRSQEVVA